MSNEIRDGKLYVETPLGTFVAYAGGDSDYPGIYIDLQRSGFDSEAPLALVEYTRTEADFEGEGHIITRVWGDVSAEDYSSRVVHDQLETFFSTVDVNGEVKEYQDT